MTRRSAALLPLLAALGCAQQNHRSSIGPVDAGVRLPALSEHAAARLAPLGRQYPRPAAHDEIAQRSWRTFTLAVPVDGTWHTPLYGQTRRWSPPTTPRRRGEHPTLESALDLDKPFDAVGEALATPFKALADSALLLPRLVAMPPTRQKRSPGAQPYDRLPPAGTLER